MTYRSRFAQKYWPPLPRSVNSVARVSERQIRFTEQFFDRLDALLPSERGVDGTPSVTDFLLLDLPRVRDRLLADYQANTLATEDLEVRVYIGAGVLVSRYAIFVAEEGETIVAFWVSIDLETDFESSVEPPR
jgi:hypothetical protein